MNRTIFFLIKIISTIIFICNLTNSDWGNNLLRILLFIISFFIFIIVTNTYQRKRGIISLGYLVYFFLLFLAHNVGPYSIIYNSHIQDLLRKSPNINVPQDHYILCFVVFVFASVAIYIYTLSIKNILHNRYVFLYVPSKQEAYKIISFFSLILFPLWIIGSRTFATILVPFTSYFIFSIWKFPWTRKKGVFVIGFFISISVIASQLFSRFIFSQYVFPFILMWLLFIGLRENDKKYKINCKIIGYFVICCFLIIVYGIISEIIKLNINFDGHYNFSDIIEIITDPQLFQTWMYRQTYRIFDIWSHLGGNIIDYTNWNGYLWGTTYIKFFAPIMGFDYVSLPIISANLIGADYAQPGLLAEGYANFGLYGSILNVLLVFFIAELFFNMFLRKQSTLNLMLYLSTYSQVLLDGGTLNSIIFMSICCVFTCSFSMNIKNKFVYEKNIIDLS